MSWLPHIRERELQKQSSSSPPRHHDETVTRKSGLTFGVMLVALCLIATGVGIALLFKAHGMPAHTDERRAAELTRLYEENYIKASPEQRKSAETEIMVLRTSKWKLYNAGLGMCLVSPLLLFAMLHFGLWDIRNLRTVKTPQTRLRLLGLASGAWLALLPALLLQSTEDYAQDDLTPTMDTGHGSFLIALPKIFLLMLIVMLVFGRFFVLRSALLPANLWCWDSERPRRSLILSALYGLAGGVLVVLIAWSAGNFIWAVPSLVIGLYVILSTRAALINNDQQA